MEHPSSGLLLLVTLPGILVLVYGIFLKFSPSQYPSLKIGYKTDLTRKNEQAWKEGNSFAGKVLIWLGVFNIILWPSAEYIFWDGMGSMIVMSWLALTMFTLAISISITESHLNRIFDREGNRKTANL